MTGNAPYPQNTQGNRQQWIGSPARIYRNAAWVTAAAGADVAFSIDSLDFDPDSRTSFGSPGANYTCRNSGIYLVTAAIGTGGTPGGAYIHAGILHNLAVHTRGNFVVAVTGGNTCLALASALVNCNGNDTLGSYYQSGTNGLTGLAGSTLAYLNVVQLY